MSRRLPPINWLRAFDSAAKHSSFRLAATELHLTPASISHQIRCLEQNLGFKLFTRLPKGVRLTDVGQAYVEPIRKTFSDLAVATSGLFESKGSETIIVRCPTSYAPMVLAPMLHDFHAKYTNIDIQLCSTVWSKSIDDDSIDIDIRYGNGRWKERYIRKLGNEFAIPVCNPGYFKIIEKELTLDKLAKMPNIQIMGAQFQWDNLLCHYGIELKGDVEWIKVDTCVTALQYVITGAGCAMVLESHAKQFLEAGLLVRPLDVRLPIESAHYVVLSNDSGVSPEVKLFCDWLLQTIVI